MHAQRGNALFETVLFLPVALVVMFAVLYFARFGVLEERAQAAVRYGALVSYETTSRYSAADIYDAVALHAPPACNPSAAADTATVLGGTGPSGSAQPFWKPDHATGATCSVTTASFTGAAWAASHSIMVTKHAVSATLDVPTYLTTVLGTSGNVSASLGYAHADPPSMVMYCVSGVASAVSAALNAAYTGGTC